MKPARVHCVFNNAFYKEQIFAATFNFHKREASFKGLFFFCNFS